MNDFCELFWRLDSSTKTLDKIKALKEYFAVAEPEDAIWAIYFLVGERVKRLVGTKLLRQWAIEQSDISPWMFEECYDRVGDLAETISLVIDATASADVAVTNVVSTNVAATLRGTDSNMLVTECQAHIADDISLKSLIEDHLLQLRDLEPEQQRDRVLTLWRSFDHKQIFVLGKLMMGGFRVGVSKKLVTRALAEHTAIDAATIAHRLMGDWKPDVAFYELLFNPDEGETAISKPYPFFLANPLKEGPDPVLGDPKDWVAEWKWDGIRAQVIRREGETFIWSRGEELVTEQFPEVAAAADQLPDGTVLDGEILGWEADADRPMEFSQLQRRLGRKRLGKKLLGEVPVVLLAFDLIEHGGEDIRTLPLSERQSRLKKLITNVNLEQRDKQKNLQMWAGRSAASKKFPAAERQGHVSGAIRIPPPVEQSENPTDWSELGTRREAAKQLRAEGLMLKRIDSAYQVGRPVGDWWKWKVEPYTIDAVLIYAQRGHGRRASLYTDYTFAVWKDDTLVPFAKAYSGLTDAEIRKVDAFVRKNTNEKFGPVRSVTPELVFELAFENVQKSTRHKSGIAVRFPRISRWRHDKKPADADSLATILSMLDN